MINKYAEIQDRILLYNACKGILRAKVASMQKQALDFNDIANKAKDLGGKALAGAQDLGSKALAGAQDLGDKAIRGMGYVPKSELDAANAAAEGRLKAILNLRNQVGDLNGQIGDLNGQIGDLNGQVGDLNGQVGDLTTDRDAWYKLNQEASAAAANNKDVSLDLMKKLYNTYHYGGMGVGGLGGLGAAYLVNKLTGLNKSKSLLGRLGRLGIYGLGLGGGVYGGMQLGDYVGNQMLADPSKKLQWYA